MRRVLTFSQRQPDHFLHAVERLGEARVNRHRVQNHRRIPRCDARSFPVIATRRNQVQVRKTEVLHRPRHRADIEALLRLDENDMEVVQWGPIGVTAD